MTIPYELIDTIITYCDLCTLINIRCINKHYSKFISHNPLKHELPLHKHASKYLSTCKSLWSLYFASIKTCMFCNVKFRGKFHHGFFSHEKCIKDRSIYLDTIEKNYPLRFFEHNKINTFYFEHYNVGSYKMLWCDKHQYYPYKHTYEYIRIDKKYIYNIPDLKNSRKIELMTLLYKSGLELRKDSSLCGRYIDDGTYLYGDCIEDIVTRMCQMKFLYDYTEYRQQLRVNYRELRLGYEDLDIYVRDVSFYGVDPKKYTEDQILQTTPFPEVWPWKNQFSPL